MALITLFDESQSIDYTALNTLIEHQIFIGILGHVTLGTTIKKPPITDDERKELTDFILKRIDDRVLLNMRVGSKTTRHDDKVFLLG